jgi:hypothetical protein
MKYSIQCGEANLKAVENEAAYVKAMRINAIHLCWQLMTEKEKEINQ